MPQEDRKRFRLLKGTTGEGFYLEPTSYGGRVHAGGPDGYVEGVVSEISPGAFAAVAFRKAKVPSRESARGWKWAPETNCGVHEDLQSAAGAVHAVYQAGPR